MGYAKLVWRNGGVMSNKHIAVGAWVGAVVTAAVFVAAMAIYIAMGGRH